MVSIFLALLVLFSVCCAIVGRRSSSKENHAAALTLTAALVGTLVLSGIMNLLRDPHQAVSEEVIVYFMLTFPWFQFIGLLSYKLVERKRRRDAQAAEKPAHRE